jgi:hypothetical protein
VRVLPSARIRGRPRRDNFVELQWEDSLQFLEEVVDAPLPPMHAVGNMRIMVPNVDDFWTLAKNMGVQVIRPIEDRSYGLRDFTIAGPDGQMGMASALRLISLISRYHHRRKAPSIASWRRWSRSSP